MKSSHKFWLVILLVPLGIVFITAVLPNLLYRAHPEPLDLSGRGEIEKLFNQEADRIELPPETEIIDRTSSNRYDTGVITVTRRYKTKLNEKAFRENIITQMAGGGWSDLGAAREGVAKSLDLFCKGRYDADLLQETRGIWQDEFNYYKLTIDLSDTRTGSYYYRKVLPQECLAE